MNLNHKLRLRSLRYSIFMCVVMLAASAHLALAAEMPAAYDAAVAGDDIVAAPAGPVNVKVDFDRPLLMISPYFYGVNVHPVPASVAFRNPALIDPLKPDVVRIMGFSRTHWVRKAGRTITVRSTISPAPGKFDWTQLDALIKGIRKFGAEPYLVLGFGAPKWMSDPSRSQRLRSVPHDRLGEYAKFMARVVQHVNVDRGFGVKWVTIDNEPENLQYPFQDYVELVRLATQAIHAVDPSVKIAGPVTGYATWKQPDGSKIGFAKGLKMLKASGIDYDLIDWHIYATNPDLVLHTVDIVKGTWPHKPLVISELNRDWRYSGKGGELSKKRNTGWYSLAWLAYCYDQLQRKGVDQVDYFCLGNGYFGLYNYHQTRTAPNYQLFRLMTNVMGRKRVETASSDKAIGVIATMDDEGSAAVLMYNRSTSPVTVRYRPPASRDIQVYRLTRAWYDAHAAIVDGKASLLAPQTEANRSTWTIPSRGLLVLAGWSADEGAEKASDAGH